jgi:ribose 5-phosphate isomerase
VAEPFSVHRAMVDMLAHYRASGGVPARLLLTSHQYRRLCAELGVPVGRLRKLEDCRIEVDDRLVAAA